MDLSFQCQFFCCYVIFLLKTIILIFHILLVWLSLYLFYMDHLFIYMFVWNCRGKISQQISFIILSHFLYYIVTFYFKSSTYKLNYYQFIKSGNIIPSLMTLQSVQNVHSLIYSLMAIFFISNYEKNAENNFSDIKSVEFLWLKRFLFFIISNFQGRIYLK